MLARVFGNSADFRLNVQRRTDLWATMNSPDKQERIARARSLKTAGTPRKPSSATLARGV